MEDEINQNEVPEVNVVVTPTGVPNEAVMMLFAVLLVVIGLAVWAARNPQENAQCVANNNTLQEQAAANKAQTNLQLAVQKRLVDVQMEVINKCSNRGGVPIFINNNVDCKQPSK